MRGVTDKSSILSSYMEDENGVDLPESTKEAVREEARNFFQLLLENNRAPAVWGDAAINIKNEYLYCMETQYPFLRFCQDHWKAKQVATNSYSQWQSNAAKRMRVAITKKKALTEVIDVNPAEDDNLDASG